MSNEDYVEPGTLLKTKRGFQVYFWPVDIVNEHGFFKGFFLVENEGRIIRLEQNICGYFLAHETQIESGLLNTSKIAAISGYDPKKYYDFNKIFKVMKP